MAIFLQIMSAKLGIATDQNLAMMSKRVFSRRTNYFIWVVAELAAMVVVSASVFHSQGMIVDTIEQAHRSLEPLLGQLSSGAFGIAL